MLGLDPPPPGTAGRVAPAQTPPPGTATKEEEGGLGKWASVPSPPRKAIFFPPRTKNHWHAFGVTSRWSLDGVWGGKRAASPQKGPLPKGTERTGAAGGALRRAALLTGSPSTCGWADPPPLTPAVLQRRGCM